MTGGQPRFKETGPQLKKGKNMEVTHVENGDTSVTITIALDVMDVKVLKHDLPGVQGIVNWYSKGPSSEKCGRCKKRMIRNEGDKLRAKGVNLPSDDSALIDLIIADVDYNDREARDLLDGAS